MGMNNPKVTVLMPVYNGEKYIREALESILNQTFTNFEFLIIDDGSTDKSVEVIKSYTDPRIRLIHNEINLGLITNLNKGLELASGEYIARMDCDDISLPKRLNVQVAFMDENPTIGVCGSWVETFGEVSGNAWKYPSCSAEIMANLLFDCCLAHPSVMIRKSMFKRYQLKYDPAELYAEDFGLWFRCSMNFPLSNIKQVLVKYRITSGSVSRANAKKQAETLKMMDRKKLAYLGIEASNGDLELHRNIGSYKFSSTPEYVFKTKIWLEKLRAANQDKQIYPKSEFLMVLAERWFWVCNNNTCLGRWVWREYWNSNLNCGLSLSFKQKLKFAVKCCLQR